MVLTLSPNAEMFDKVNLPFCGRRSPPNRKMKHASSEAGAYFAVIYFAETD